MYVEIDSKNLSKLEQSIAKSPEKIRTEFDKYLWSSKAAGQVKKDIKTIIPRSTRQPKSRKGQTIPRAADANSLKNSHIDLGFKVSTIRRYNYLRFPDEGSGTSAGKVPKEFFAKGLEKNEDRIINDLLEIAEKVLSWSK